jgi:hypothetical protein
MLGQGLGGLVSAALWLLPMPALAQSVELTSLQAARDDTALSLEFSARVTLSKAVQDALQRGVPVYFVAQAQLLRQRWYWRDERVARVTRSWRVAYQPLTSSWRVGLGGLNQTYPTLAEAMTAVTRSSQWRLAEVSQLDPEARYYIEFSWRLDTTQLPSPMQIGLTVQADWSLGVERVLRLD